MSIRIGRRQLQDIVWAFFLGVNFAHQRLFQGIQLISVVCLVLVSLYCCDFRVNLYRNRNVFGWYCIFTVYMFFSQLWAIGITSTSNVLDISWRICAVVLCACMYIDSFEAFERLLKIFMCATVYFVIIYYVTSPVSTWGTTQMGSYTNQFRNYAGYMACFGALTAAYFFQKSRNRMYILIATICIVGAVLTGSRKVFVQIAMAVGLYILLDHSIKRKIKNVFLASIIGVVTIGILYSNPAFQKFINEKILTMFLNENMTFVSTYAADAAASTKMRQVLAETAMEMFRINPLFGCGVDSVRYYLGTYMRELMTVTYSHNNYTEVLACFGLVGFGLYYSKVIMAIIRNIRNRMFSSHTDVRRYLSIFFISYCVLDYATISYYYILTILLLSIHFCGMNYLDDID